ncbi:LANO_0E00804g1_1 [Lachancea nothofagi CBS 11611]|uniref:6-phosphogluconolactonase-like protein n=1 Tax=Lachancea nothofagi CBS 11611 TaxID=1266666 RepID=A0A1G4JP38_9SACH|nr:LANO_0E00804g1_1 [Lachancea nothofagi CBS 11611]
MASVYTYDDSKSLAHDLADYILSKQDKALEKGKRFNIAVSGGSLLKALNSGLIQDPEFQKKVQWSHWHVYFCDERIVALENEDSNYGAFKKLVLDPLLETDGALGPTCYAINESLVGLSENDRLAAEYESLLPEQFDLILLGCGPDGHTCSLFPGKTHEYLLQETNKRVAWCHSSPKPPADRITFTLPTLQSAEALCFVAEGASKQPILERIFEGHDTSLPAGLVTENYQSCVSWFVDQAAVKGVSVKKETYSKK